MNVRVGQGVGAVEEEEDAHLVGRHVEVVPAGPERGLEVRVALGRVPRHFSTLLTKEQQNKHHGTTRCHTLKPVEYCLTCDIHSSPGSRLQVLFTSPLS